MDFPLPFPGCPIVFLGLKQQTLVPFLNWRDPLEKEEATHSSILGLLWRLCKESVKNPPAMWETWVQSLGWEDPLEEGMATHSSILAWRSPTDRGAWQAAVHGVAKSWTRLRARTEQLSTDQQAK